MSETMDNKFSDRIKEIFLWKRTSKVRASKGWLDVIHPAVFEKELEGILSKSDIKNALKKGIIEHKYISDINNSIRSVYVCKNAVLPQETLIKKVLAFCLGRKYDKLT